MPDDPIVRLQDIRKPAPIPKRAGEPAEFSDDAIALRFAACHQSELRHVAQWGKWILWRQSHWQEDDTLKVFDLSRSVCRAESASVESNTQAAALASAKTVSAVVNLARSDRRLALPVDVWDCDQRMLNTPVGTINAQEIIDEIRPHNPLDYITKITAAPPDPSCEIPLWRQFLDRVTGGEEELQQYLQRIAGYCCTGITSEQVLFFLYGTGANGKGVFVNTVAGILGDYAMTAPMDTFVVTKSDRHPTDLAGMRGTRLVIATEIEKNARWAEAKIKTLTGGDKIRARFMRQDFFEFEVTFKLMICGNHKPSLSGVNEAIRRRFHLIPFSVTIPAAERDTHLFEKLKPEWPGILFWMLQGCSEWQRIGLAPPRAVTADYLSEEDALSLWIEECCITDNRNEWDTSSNLFQSYKDWAQRRNEDISSQRKFSQDLDERGYHSDRTMTARGHKGIVLRTTQKQRNETTDRY
jgi:putative DNA primase/helicase